MRIKKIELENLNSLKGYWCIDFDHANYVKNHNQFVISGPTGSGKTTILDAITLALYGKTPRQNRITQNENLLMTRHTGFCMARVTYECEVGVVISEFTQRRAKDNYKGNLQKAQATIKVDDVTVWSGTPGGSSDNLEEKTKRYIGLDYSQFCQSIMLAQGEFDKFINSNPNDRAEILAKISRTESYKNLGAKIWSIADDVKKKYDELSKNNSELKARIDAVNPAEIDEEQKLIRQQLIENRKKKEENQQNIVWIESFSEIQAKKDSAQKSEADICKAKNEFEPDRIRLSNASKADKCRSVYDFLKKLNDDEFESREKLNKARGKVSDLETKVDEATRAFEEVNMRYEQAKSKNEQDKKAWNEVRALDARIDTLKDAYDDSVKNTNKAKTNLDKASERKAEIEFELKETKDVLSKNNEYVKANEKDRDLDSIITQLMGKRKNISDFLTEMKKYRTTIDEQTELMNKDTDELGNTDEEITRLDSELRELISSEYRTISVYIRASLEKGKACPVCGSENHPFCNSDSVESLKITEGESGAAARAVQLSSCLEDVRKRKEEINDAVNKRKMKIEEAEKVLADYRTRAAAEIDAVNILIAPWNEELIVASDYKKSCEEIDSITKKFRAQKSKFDDVTSSITEYDQNFNSLTSALNEIRIDDLTEVYNQAKQESDNKLTLLDELTIQRRGLFGDKSVDKEEKAGTDAVKKLERQKNTALDYKATVETEKAKNEQRIVDLEQACMDRKPKLEKAKNDFEKALADNGIKSEDEYHEFFLATAEIDTLQKQSEYLKNEETKIKEALRIATKEYEELLGRKKTELTRDELNVEKTALEETNDLLIKRQTQLMSVLETFNDDKKKYEDSLPEYEDAIKKNVLWGKMRSFIGQKSGSDFQEFVQGYIFKTLLKAADGYLYAISGKYHFVQIGNKVDFKIHDINFDDGEKDDRPISTLSGGERFIVSLSLALGISQLASQGNRVDCLVLDEGFGTLSGEPLTEAINALKRLQDSGKMLGIITHVDTVIDSFDQRIEVFPTSGGVSKIKGSGISQDRS